MVKHFNGNGGRGDEFKLEVLEMRYWMKVIIGGIKEFYGLSFLENLSMDVGFVEDDSRKRCQNIFNVLKKSAVVFKGIIDQALGNYSL